MNADSLISQSSVIGNNMFAYCGNNPVNNSDSTGHYFGAAIGAIVGGILGGLTAAASGKSIAAGIATGALSGAFVGGICDGTTWAVGAVIGAMAKCAVVGAVGNLMNQSANYAIEQYKYNQSNSSTTKKKSSSNSIASPSKTKNQSYSEYIDTGEIVKAAFTTAAFVPLAVGGGHVVNSLFENIPSVSRFIAEGAMGINVSTLQTSVEYIITIFEP